jgi:hypothetical protein
MAARKAPTAGRIWTPELVRSRIRTGLLMRRLQNQALGNLELTQGQQRAIEILLRKTLPDLSAVQHSGSVEMTKPDELADSLLAHIATGGSAGAVEPSSGPHEPTEVH